VSIDGTVFTSASEEYFTEHEQDFKQGVVEQRAPAVTGARGARISREGSHPPNLHFFPSLAQHESGLYAFPIAKMWEDVPYDPARNACRSFGYYKKGNAEESENTPGELLERFQHSVYPTLKQVLGAGVGLSSKEIGGRFLNQLFNSWKKTVLGCIITQCAGRATCTVCCQSQILMRLNWLTFLTLWMLPARC